MSRTSYVAGVLGFLAMLLGAFTLSSCSAKPDFWEEAKPNQKRILVSFPPLYAFTHAVAGEHAYVLSMLTLQGPHDYEGTQMDLFKVNKADLYIYNGLILDDHFSNRMLQSHANPKLRMLNVGAALDKKQPDLIIRGLEKVKHEDHWHGAEDMHVWLGPPQAIAITEIIADKLADIDPANAEQYKKNAADYVKKLNELHAYGKEKFKDKKSRKFITMHDSMRYFAKAFGLEAPAPIQKKAGIDPDGKRIADLMNLCKTENIRVIAIEPQFAAAQAELMRDDLKRRGIDVKIVTIDPLETADKKGKYNPDPDYYLKKMRTNIDTLANALP